MLTCNSLISWAPLLNVAVLRSPRRSHGLTFAMGNAPFMAMLQSAVPNHLQGRVLSLLNTLIGLAGPVGLALAAPLGEALGSRGLFVLLGACGGLVMLLGFASRALRRMEQGESGGPAGG